MPVNFEPTEQGSYCLSCGTALKGEYCHYCGQKRLKHEHGALGTFVHFIGDFFHFDSLIFRSLIPLLFRPGFLTKEYVSGRRASYLNPIKMYVFLSIVFFSLFFISGQKNERGVKIQSPGTPIFEEQKVSSGGVQLNFGNSEILLNDEGSEDARPLVWDGIRYSDLAAYRARQDSLTNKMRDGVVKQWFVVKIFKINEKMGNLGSFWEEVSDNFMHNLPKLAFILLPFIALWIKLLYVRGNVTYLQHLIFTIQWYNFNFVLGILVMLLAFIPSFEISELWQMLVIMIYVCLAMKTFYAQSWRKTIVKALLFWYGTIILLGVGVVVNTIISILLMS